MKKISFIFLCFIFLLLQTIVCFAGNLSFDGKPIWNTASGNSLPSGNIVIKLNGTEMKYCKDTISITLDGAEWDRDSYDATGNIDKYVSYQLENNNTMKLSIKTDEDILKNGYSFEIPIKGKITKDIAQIKAVMNYGYDDINEQSVVLAGCRYTRAYLDGNVKERKKGDKIFQRGSKILYNKLKIFVAGNDFDKTRDKITVKLIGATWSDYESKGFVSCDKAKGIRYEKISNDTIVVRINGFEPEMKLNGYTLEFPLTGTITGSGEIKAVVDFGTEDIEPSTVVFARCIDGELSVKSSDPDSPIDSCNSIGDIIIDDSSTQGYKAYTKFELSLDHSFSFIDLPKIKCSEKFADKCNINFDKSGKNKVIITLTQNIDSGATGTITLVSPIIKRPGNNQNKFTKVNAHLTAEGWEKYDSKTKIAQYVSGANIIPPIQVSTTNPNAWANKNARPGNLTIFDVSDRTYKKGDRLIMTFDSDFHWFTKGALPWLNSFGKFKNKCKFEYNYDNPNEAYIVFKDDINGNEGSIVIAGFAIERDSDKPYKYINIIVSQKSDPLNNAKTQIGKFYSLCDYELQETSSQTTTETTTEATTTDLNDNSKKITFKIGSTTYNANGTTYELLSAPYIKDSYTMLPIRAIANAVGITDDKISYNNGTAVFTLPDNAQLTISAGNKSYSIGNEIYTCYTAPEIKEGTMFLPMRNLANVVGIADNNIIFNNETKEVTLIIKPE